MSTYTGELEGGRGSGGEAKMSFLDHLDELRSRLVRCAMFIAAAFVVCWFFHIKIYQFLEVPVRAAMVEARRTGAINIGDAEYITLNDLPDGEPVRFRFATDCKLGDTLVPAGTNIGTEVRRTKPGDIPRLVTTENLMLSDQHIVRRGLPIPSELMSPNAEALSPEGKLVILQAQGAFNLYMKVSLYAALFFSVPFILWQAWSFISPGLYEHEKKYATPFLAMASVFFLLGCAFAYYVAFPRAANFLLGVAAEGNLRPQLTADDYFNLINTIMLGLGLVFEIPTVTFFLSRIGLISHRFLLVIWRYAVLAIFILAAVLSPTTDIPNMLVFAAPMLMLYFFSVGIAYVFYRKRHPEPDAQS
ncbi:MAG TPA: twin-arginine translocase subunit TatC [Blastocatellia bacterium]|nr:twin-arginine translocase subunit TatC [Blastocatellia bacterium]